MDMLDRRSILGAAMVGLAAPAWLPALAAPLTRSRAGLIFVAVTIDGRVAKALVDTGGSRGLQLSEAFAASLRLTLAETGRRTQRYDGQRPVLGSRVKNVAFGGAAFRDVEVAVSPGDIENISRQIGESFDAILGWPLLGSRPFEIDYARNALNVGSAGRASGGIVLPLEAGRPLPVTSGTLAGQACTFLIDTGAPHCNVDPSMAGGAAINSQVELALSIGGQSLKTTFRVKDLSAMTRGLGARAVIGDRLLRKYRLIWRPEARAIHLS